MRHMKVYGPLGLMFLWMFFSPSQQLLQAQQIPAAGTTVVVKLIDAVDSASDSPGKQYQASVSRQVNSGGVTIPQGADATVTLARDGSDWTAKLSSVVINGNTVAVTSNSASVTRGGQNAVGSAANEVSSVLAGFGHHKNVPVAVSAVATGQRVVLPPGTTLNFVLAGMPVASKPPAPLPTPAQTHSAASSVSSGSGSTYYTICRYQGQKNGHPIVYVTPFIQTDAAATTISTSYVHYIEATYDMVKIQYGNGYCREVSSSADQRAYTMSLLEKQWTASKTEVIHVNWTYTPTEAEASNAAVAAQNTPTAAANQMYGFCSSDPDEPVVYFSDIYVTEAPPIGGPQGRGPGNGAGQRNASAKIQRAFLAYLQKSYGFKSGSNYPVGCAVTYRPTAAGLNAAQNSKAQLEDKYRQARKQVVETGWKNP